MRALVVCAIAFECLPLTARAEIPPNENLVVDGLPAIADAVAAEAGPYGEGRSATPLAWHPVRREILIATRFGDTPQIHSVAFPGADRRQVTFFRDRVSSAFFPPDPHRGDHFVFSRDVAGGEAFQIYRHDLTSGATTMLTDGKSRNDFGRFSRAGVRMAYTTNRRNGKDTDIHVIDPRDPKSDRLLAQLEGGGWRPLDWSPDSRRLLVQETVSIAESYLWTFDSIDGTREPLTPRGPGPEKVRYTGGAFTADGRAVYTTTDQDSEFLRMARIDLETKGHAFLTDLIPWDVDEFDLSRDGRTLALITNEDGIGVLRLFDALTGRERPRPRLPPGSVQNLRFHPNGRDLAFGLASARRPEDVYSLDVWSGRVERWTDSENGGVDTSRAREPELVKWPSFDGRTITGYMYLPPAGRFPGPRPVMIDIHGGPESQFRPGYLGRLRYLVDGLGVALLFPNVRGSTGYGKTFTRLDNGARREDAVKDIGGLLDWIDNRDDLDRGKVMVMGAGYGGYLALAAAFHFARRLRCAVDEGGMSNLFTYLSSTDPSRRDLRRVEYGDERDPNMQTFFKRIAPIVNAERIIRPLFVVQGRNDPVVPVREAEQLVAALKKQYTPIWYLMARNEGRDFIRKPNADFQFFATVAFIKTYLLPKTP
jgi:dipeptidyl aminopeptidase/acylaminoacyl peptidase